MLILSILGTSVLLQFAAAFMALRLISITGRRSGWLVLSLAIILMGWRRSITLYHVASGNGVLPRDLSVELVALAISALMVIGLAWITPLFKSIKRSENSLKLAYAELDQAFNAPAMAMTVIGRDFTVLRVNDRLSGLLGLPKDEIVGRKCHETWTVPLCHTLDCPMTAIMEGRELVEYEAEMDLRNGATISCFATAAPYLGADGERLGIVESFIDVTDDKRAREALRESEERYHKILEVAPDPVVLYDMTGRVTYLNPAFTRVFGWRLEEVLGRRIDFVPQEAKPETLEIIERVKRGESFSSVQTRRYDKWGRILDVSVSAAVMRNSDGGPVGSVINLRDVTEQRKMEAQLRQAQKMEAVGALAGGVAHDFNNILQVISGSVQLLLIKGDPSDSAAGYLTKIDKSIQRATELVRQLLTFSRKVESQKQSLDLNDEIGQAAGLLGSALPKTIDIEVHLAEDLWPIDADATQLEQIILNLATNARDAMPDGGRLIFKTENVFLDKEHCRRYLGLKPGRYVQLSIQDTGTGMNRETLDRIFEPFFTTKKIGQGTGLGLATAYGIVKAHGGQITCYSEIDQGTIFKVYLPAASAAAEGAVEEPEEDIPAGVETILVVDDEIPILEVAQDLLSQYGYRVLTASSGKAALDIYRDQRGEIELVILDLGMPGMGGDQCLEELMKLDPEVKIIIASGYPVEDRIEELADKGVAGFIGKPYRLAGLLQKVREVLDGALISTGRDRRRDSGPG